MEHLWFSFGWAHLLKIESAYERMEISKTHIYKELRELFPGRAPPVHPILGSYNERIEMNKKKIYNELSTQP